MGQVVKKGFRWQPSTAPDVVKYEVYVSNPGGKVDFASKKWEFPQGTPQFDSCQLTIPDDLPGFPQTEAVYELGVVAYDDVGNFSDMAVLSAPFDFDAPAAPTGLELFDL